MPALEEWLDSLRDSPTAAGPSPERWLAGHLGVHEVTVSKWKTGQHMPRWKHAKAIVRLSEGDVTLADLVDLAVSHAERLAAERVGACDDADGRPPCPSGA